MQLAHRAVLRLWTSRAFHASSCCRKQELFEEWQRPLNKAQLKVIRKAQMRNNPRYNARFQQDATTLVHKAYSRTTEEHHLDKVTLQQLRNIVRECAGDRFDVIDISTHTYALPLRNQPAEFLIVDSQCPNGRSPEVMNECCIVYDADAFVAVLEKHGFKCFGQHVSKEWPGRNAPFISKHGKRGESRESYELPMTFHVSRSEEIEGHPHLPVSPIIPSISFSLTLPHPAVLPLNRLLTTYFRLAPEIPQVWALALLWVRSLGLGTSTPGMKSMVGTPDLIQSSGRQDIAFQSLPYVEELSPTCLALLFLVHLVEANRLPNPFDTKDRGAVLQESEPQFIWIPYTHRSSSHCGQAQVTQQTSRQSYPQWKWVQTPTQIDIAFACHVAKCRFQVKIPKLINSFFTYISACTESRHHYYSLRKGGKVPRDMSFRSQPHLRVSAAHMERIKFPECVPQRYHGSWKLDRLAVQDPFISTYNHATHVSSVTLHRIAQCAKMARKRVVHGHPMWAMFGPHLRPPTAPDASHTQGNHRIPKKTHIMEMTDSSPSAADPTQESPPPFRNCLRLLDNHRTEASSNRGEQVVGTSLGSPMLKPMIHHRPLGASQFSRGVYTKAARPPNDKAVEETVYKTENADPPRIKFDFPPIDKKIDVTRSHDKTNKKDQVIRKVRHVIKDRYGPRYDVQPYGSSVYMVGHSPDGGDLDLVVLDSKWPQGFTPEIDMKDLPPIYDTRTLARAMRYAGFTDVVAIPWARVPIVKFTDPTSGLNVDINVNERLGLLNTNLVKTYCDVVPDLRCLVSATKKWARPRALNDPSASGGLKTFSSYALMLMTIAWLQTRGLAPMLQASLPSMETDEHLFWMRPRHPSKRIPCDTRYHKSPTWVAPPGGTSLDNLVEQWFRFWAGFQFSCYVIDIKRGGIYPRIHHFEDVADYNNVPRDPRFETRRNWSAFMSPDVDPTTMVESCAISVVDPFIRSRNVTKGIDAEGLNLFRAECESASELLKLGANMTDVIDGFDLIKQDFDRYRKAGRIHVNRSAGSNAAAGILREINIPKLADVPEPPQTGVSVERIPLSDALGSSCVVDGADVKPPRDAPLGSERVRDNDEEGFGLKGSYFKQHHCI